MGCKVIPNPRYRPAEKTGSEDGCFPDRGDGLSLHPEHDTCEPRDTQSIGDQKAEEPDCGIRDTGDVALHSPVAGA